MRRSLQEDEKELRFLARRNRLQSMIMVNRLMFQALLFDMCALLLHCFNDIW